MEGHALSQGPCASLLNCLFKVAWSWDPRGFWLDQNLDTLDVMQLPKPELAERMCQAWQTRAMCIVEGLRKTMKGASQADVALTNECLTSLPNDHQGLMRCALNGTQFTNDALAHANVVVDSTCRFCDARDSPCHRHWSCPFFQDIRQDFPNLRTLPETEQQCLLNHGWLPKSPHQLALHRQMEQIPDNTTEFFHPDVNSSVEYHDLFLDGSCIHPNDKFLRVASWGVVLWDGTQFAPLTEGCVPGRRQTSLRGEILAAIAAVTFATRSSKPCRLWVDNQHVVNVLRDLLTNPFADLTGKKDADLWLRLQLQLRVASPNVKQVFKVQAHALPHDQETPLDTWATLGNQSADACAANARSNLPASFWTTWSKLDQSVTTWRQLGRQLHSMYVAIAIKAQHAKTMPDQHVVTPVGISMPAELHADPALTAVAATQPDRWPKKFRVEVADSILAWIQQVSSPRQPAIWVSYHQLLLHYQKFSGRNGPQCDGKTWTNQQPDLYEHRQQVQWFARYLQNLCKDVSQPLTVQQRRPPSHVLTFWSGHIAVCLSPDDLLCTDTFLQKHVDRLPARQIRRDMANVPPGWAP